MCRAIELLETYVSEIPPRLGPSLVNEHSGNFAFGLENSARPLLCAPSSIKEIPIWAKEKRTTLYDAKRRFVASVILFAVASDSVLSATLASRGSFAMELFYGCPRRAQDLDFVSLPHANAKSLMPTLPALLDRMSRAIGRAFPMAVPGPHGMAVIAGTAIRFEISPSRIKRPVWPVALHRKDRPILQVFYLEDLIAEKLEALLASRDRRRKPRPQDVYDIAWTVMARRDVLSSALVAQLLKDRLCVETYKRIVTTMDTPLRERQREAYEKLIPLATRYPIPFRDAWEAVAAFFQTIVESL